MRTGRTFEEFKTEISRQAEAKKDFLIPMPEFRMDLAAHEERPFLRVGDNNFGITEIGHATIAQRMEIPVKYYDRMLKECPQLLAINVSGWAAHESNAKKVRMIRTMDGEARAMLSNRYLRLDNADFLDTVLPAIDSAQVDDIEVMSSEVTDRRMYIQLTFPNLQRELQIQRGQSKVGDVVKAGLILTNSEVGFGCREIRFLLYTLSCTNGMVLPRDFGGMKTRHTGSMLGTSYMELSQEAQEAENKAFALATRDVVRQLTSPEHMDSVVRQLQETDNRRITGDVTGSVREVAKTFNLTKDEQSSVLDFLIKGGSLSQYGLMNAVTETANKHESYDRAVELESIGGQIFEMAPTQIKPILEARPS